MVKQENAFAVLDTPVLGAERSANGAAKGDLRRRRKRRSSASGKVAQSGSSPFAAKAAPGNKALEDGVTSQDSAASTSEALDYGGEPAALQLPQTATPRVPPKWPEQTANGAVLSRAGSAVPAARPPPERSRDAECMRQGSFVEYLTAELDPSAGARQPSAAELVRGQNERQRVYNALLSVPYQLEQFLLFGLLICLDSFLAIFTVLPVRFARAALAALRCMAGRRPGRRPRAGGLAADQLFDVLCVLIFGALFGVMRLLPAGAIYFWLKDLTQEFLKLHVVHSAVEIFDKIACTFVVDSLEALSGSCVIFVTGHGSRWAAGRLAADAAVTLALVIAHGMVLLGQVMTFSVAMNSARGHALVALLIASNFVEIKGTIFKRFDAGKLFTLTCQDVAERFHLALALLFVVVEEMDNAGSSRPNAALLQRCAGIFAAEVAIDVTKHAVVTKFSDVRPGVYRTFLHDVCEKTRDSQSHTAHRVVAFEPYAPAALFMRIAATYFGAYRAPNPSSASVTDGARWAVTAGRVGGALVAWAALFAAKAALGFWLRAWAVHHLRRAAKRAR